MDGCEHNQNQKLGSLRLLHSVLFLELSWREISNIVGFCFIGFYYWIFLMLLSAGIATSVTTEVLSARQPIWLVRQQLFVCLELKVPKD